jgi:hypothetical protein
MAKLIRQIRGTSIGKWKSWVQKELCPPLVDNVRNNPEVIQVLEAFADLIRQVDDQNKRTIKEDPKIDDVFMDLLK